MNSATMTFIELNHHWTKLIWIITLFSSVELYNWNGVCFITDEFYSINSYSPVYFCEAALNQSVLYKALNECDLSVILSPALLRPCTSHPRYRIWFSPSSWYERWRWKDLWAESSSSSLQTYVQRLTLCVCVCVCELTELWRVCFPVEGQWADEPDHVAGRWSSGALLLLSGLRWPHLLLQLQLGPVSQHTTHATKPMSVMTTWAASLWRKQYATLP